MGIISERVKERVKKQKMSKLLIAFMLLALQSNGQPPNYKRFEFKKYELIPCIHSVEFIQPDTAKWKRLNYAIVMDTISHRMYLYRNGRWVKVNRYE